MSVSDLELKKLEKANLIVWKENFIKEKESEMQELKLKLDEVKKELNEIKDKFGDLAKIDIKDFILYYGQDVVYSYYLDLNGDGKLNKDNELIGQVLCRTAHDERSEMNKLQKL